VQPEILTYNGDTYDNAADVIAKALNSPIASAPLAQLASGKRSAAILVSDMTRLCPSYIFLENIVNVLNAAGLADSQIKIIVALGSHRKQTEKELESLTGNTVYRRIKVQNHSAQSDDCVYVGTTSQGTPVEINRLVVEADLRIVTGNIEPHGLVGMSGGVKALVPGVSSVRTIERNHSLSQKYKITPGDIDNPIHRDLEEALQFVPIHYLFNVIVNHRREMIDAVSGDVIAAHRAGTQIAKEKFIVPAEQKYDLTIASTGGFPKDIQLYQAIKTLQNAAKITKPGGKIILAARCQEMFGNGIFQYWMDTVQDRSKIVQMLQQQFVLGAHKVEHLDQILQQHEVFLYSDIPDSVAELVGFHPVEQLQSVLDQLLSGPANVAIIPYGAVTFPHVESHVFH
jgi:nickel-dependent lactate racemase